MPKHNELNINRKHEKKLRWEYNLSKPDEYEPHDFRTKTNKRWRVYQKLCARVVRRAGGPITLAEIHRRLGKWKYDQWTMLALAGADNILHIPGKAREIYAWEPHMRVLEKDALTRTNASLFVGNVQYEKRRRPAGKTWNGRAAV